MAVRATSLARTLPLPEMYNTLKFTIMKNSCFCLMSAVGGALVGAAIAMLVTPQSGKELRGKIRHAFEDSAERLREEVDHLRSCDCDK